MHYHPANRVDGIPDRLQAARFSANDISISFSSGLAEWE
jgi:hypothetical protein